MLNPRTGDKCDCDHHDGQRPVSGFACPAGRCAHRQDRVDRVVSGECPGGDRAIVKVGVVAASRTAAPPMTRYGVGPRMKRERPRRLPSAATVSATAAPTD